MQHLAPKHDTWRRKRVPITPMAPPNPRQMKCFEEERARHAFSKNLGYELSIGVYFVVLLKEFTAILSIYAQRGTPLQISLVYHSL